MANTTPNRIRPTINTSPGRHHAAAQARSPPARSRARRPRRRAVAPPGPGRWLRRISSRRGRLHDAVADHPQRQKSADLRERPAQHRVQKYRQADHEPDVTRTEQKEARRRQPLIAGRVGEHLGEFRLFGLPKSVRSSAIVTSKTSRSVAANTPSAPRKPTPAAAPAEKETDTFERILRTGEHGDPLEQLRSAPPPAPAS